MTAMPSGELQIEVGGDAAGRTVLVVAGELDPATAPRLRTAAAAVIAAGDALVLDLAGVTFIDSSGVAVLIATQRELRATDRRLVVRQPSTMVRRVLELAQLTDELTLE